MAEPSDNPCSSSSEDDEYSDPLEVAAAGAGLSTPEKAGISRKRKVQTYPNVNIAGNGFIPHAYTRVCPRNFICLISILAKFVLLEYNHVVMVIESQYRESEIFMILVKRDSV